jgi:hypothetical protein
MRRSLFVAGCFAVLIAAIPAFIASGRVWSPISAQAPQAGSSQADVTWKWSDRIGEFWKRLSAGPSLKPAAWPDVAVALSFDYQMGSWSATHEQVARYTRSARPADSQ